MLSKGYLVVLVISAGCALVNGNAAGAPMAACDELAPSSTSGHGDQSTAVSPYSVATSATEYNTAAITITVTAVNAQLKGILCQVRKEDGTPVGTFAVANAKYKVTQCTNAMDSVTHDDGTDKGTSAMFTWTPPGGDMNDLKAVCTFVKSRSNDYWVKIEAPMMLTYYGGDGGDGGNGGGDGDGDDDDDDDDDDKDKNAASSFYGYASLSLMIALTAGLVRKMQII